MDIQEIRAGVIFGPWMVTSRQTPPTPLAKGGRKRAMAVMLWAMTLGVTDHRPLTGYLEDEVSLGAIRVD